MRAARFRPALAWGVEAGGHILFSVVHQAAQLSEASGNRSSDEVPLHVGRLMCVPREMVPMSTGARCGWTPLGCAIIVRVKGSRQCCQTGFGAFASAAASPGRGSGMTNVTPRSACRACACRQPVPSRGSLPPMGRLPGPEASGASRR